MDQLPLVNRTGLPVGALLALALIGAELVYGRLAGRTLYELRESGATLVIVVGNQLLRIATTALAAVPLLWAWDWRLTELPLDRPVTWVVLFVAVELVYYWHHRTMHLVRWLWATHSVHHSARRINLAAGLRLGWGNQLSGGVLFYVPLVLLGFHPLAVTAVLSVNLGYQFLLHTECIPRLGLLEWVLNTPAHHRVHHASNESCLDRNFGGMLIVYDRLFGTFAEAPANETLRYGLKGAVPTDNPLKIVVAGWAAIAQAAMRARSLRDFGAALFGRP